MSEVTAIITCMTDGERPFLMETLLSVSNQTIPCETIVVVVESNSWINEIAREFPSVQILRRPPGLLGSVRNSGVAASITEFVAFLDGDDIWLPTKIERQLNFLRDGRHDFVGVDHMLMTERGEVFAYALARNIPMPSSWMVRRNTMLRFPFDPHLAQWEDGAWWLATRDNVDKWRIPEPLIRYRVRGQSLSTKTPSKRRKLALAKLSTVPTLRPLMLSATWLLHCITRRDVYLPLKEWRLLERAAS